MEQQRALNALEPFLALSKSATSPRAAADLVTQATSAANTYVFAELLQTPNIQALRESTEYAPYLRLLEIFAWGTSGTYNASENMPKLTAHQTQKLQLLTLLPLLSSPPAGGTDGLSYQYLQKALDLSSHAELESLIQTALYASLVEGHLDPLHQRVAITAVAPLRDLAPNSLPQKIEMLEEWEARCDSVLGEIERDVENIRAGSKARSEGEQRRTRIFEEELAKEDKSAKKDGSGELMDLDDAGGSGRSGGLSARGVKRNLRTMFSR